MTRTALAIVLAGILAGCSGPATGGKDEEAVRAAFVALQGAIKEKDAEKIWAILDKDSQADAERVAKAVREAFAKATAEEKTKSEKELGLKGDELAALKGVDFLKTKRFLGKYDEIAGSKIDKVTAQGDTGTVNYTEPDNDKEKLTFSKQGGSWKVSLAMPR
jgi:hypothetical protein